MIFVIISLQIILDYLQDYHLGFHRSVHNWNSHGFWVHNCFAQNSNLKPESHLLSEPNFISESNFIPEWNLKPEWNLIQKPILSRAGDISVFDWLYHILQGNYGIFAYFDHTLFDPWQICQQNEMDFDSSRKIGESTEAQEPSKSCIKNWGSKKF